MTAPLPDPAPIIIDTDANFPSDDVQSLLLALNCPSLDVVGVSAAAGNTYAEEVAANLDALLRLMGKADIPIARGAAFHDLPRSHGAANELKSRRVVPFIGSFQKAEKPRLTHAAWDRMPSLHGLIAQQPRQVDLVCLGPLTNVSAALGADPSLRSRIRHIWAMGGNIGFDPAVPKMDFNVWFDPQAAQTVFDSGIPMTVFPYETCRQFRSSLRTLDSVTAKGSAGLARLFAADFRGMSDQHGPELPLCDHLVALSLIEPRIVRRSRRVRMVVDQNAGDHHGSSVCLDDESSPLHVVHDIDAGTAVRTMLSAVDRLATQGSSSHVDAFLNSDVYRLDTAGTPEPSEA